MRSPRKCCIHFIHNKTDRKNILYLVLKTKALFMVTWPGQADHIFVTPRCICSQPGGSSEASVSIASVAKNNNSSTAHQIRIWQILTCICSGPCCHWHNCRIVMTCNPGTYFTIRVVSGGSGNLLPPSTNQRCLSRRISFFGDSLHYLLFPPCT